jgi:DNA modification methylase
MLIPEGQPYHLHFGDAITHMHDMPPESVDFSVYSPPFPSLYAYSSSEADIGNSEDMRGETKLHLSFFYRAMLRLMKPGRVMMVHVAQIPRMKRAGGQGLFDFRGFNIRLAERAGFVFEYDWVVRKNPQSQALRTRSRELQFMGLESDRVKSRGALPDYLLKFRAPGENAVEVVGQDQINRVEWVSWAECCWQDIRETDTLNTKEAMGEDDTKHICPLQLGVIRRLVRLYTNPAELVFSPFAGIGSEGYCSLLLGRRFYGCELKSEYHATALKNLDRAVELRKEQTADLFEGIEVVSPEQPVEDDSGAVVWSQLAKTDTARLKLSGLPDDYEFNED